MIDVSMSRINITNYLQVVSRDLSRVVDAPHSHCIRQTDHFSRFVDRKVECVLRVAFTIGARLCFLFLFSICPTRVDLLAFDFSIANIQPVTYLFCQLRRSRIKILGIARP